MRRRRSSLFLFVLTACCYSSASAAHDQSYGFVWAYDSTADSYTPSEVSSYAYNDSGSRIEITRSGPGAYEVRFDKLFVDYDPNFIGQPEGELGTVQVTAYGTANRACKLAGAWDDESIPVQCRDLAGNPADAPFTLLYYLVDRHPNQHTAYAYASLSSEPSYTPLADAAYNPNGEKAIVATRTAEGVYRMAWTDFGDIGVAGGHVQVTAVGADDARCQVSSWFGDSTTIRCFDSSGVPADSGYTVLYARPSANDPGIAFAWADSPTLSSYSPAPAYLHHPEGGTATITRGEAGRYVIQWDGLPLGATTLGHVQVSAYGSTEHVCSVRQWSPARAEIECRDSSGDLEDSWFNVMRLDPPKRYWTSELATAYISDSSTHGAYIDEFRSFNPGGGPIAVTKSAAGEYIVDFVGLAERYSVGGTVQVSAFTNLGHYCNVAHWSRSESTVRVQCRTRDGSPAEFTSFLVAYLKGTNATPGAAYARPTQVSTSSYSPDPNYANNPGGGAIVTTRLGVGRYHTEFAGFDSLGLSDGNAQVTTYGDGNDARCKVEDWIGDDTFVVCRTPAGAHVDSEFSVVLLRPRSDDSALAFAWSGGVVPPAAPDPLYAFNTGDGPITASRFSVGNYRVEWDGLGEHGTNGGIALVNAYDTNDGYCNLSSLGTDAIGVRCWNAAGIPIDSTFSLVYLKPTALPEPGSALLIAAGGALLAGLGRRRTRR